MSQQCLEVDTNWDINSFSKNLISSELIQRKSIETVSLAPWSTSAIHRSCFWLLHCSYSWCASWTRTLGSSSEEKGTDRLGGICSLRLLRRNEFQVNKPAFIVGPPLSCTSSSSDHQRAATGNYSSPLEAQGKLGSEGNSCKDACRGPAEIVMSSLLQKKGSNVDDGLLPHAPWVLYFDGASRKPAGKEFFEVAWWKKPPNSTSFFVKSSSGSRD